MGFGVDLGFFLEKNSPFGEKDYLSSDVLWVGICQRIWNYQLASGHSILGRQLATDLRCCQHHVLRTGQCETHVVTATSLYTGRKVVTFRK